MITIYYSNLIGMGIMPLQFVEGQSADSLGLTGRETFTIDIPTNIVPSQRTLVHVSEHLEHLSKFDTV